uniref:RNA-directed RNA polymerase L n=1 Tax=Rhizoctonia cerealis bunyavirus TaxID=3068840 RepID=A0AA51GH68_9VIRU|nr:MAG: RNA-dependent RNA polymerase [Rhizoctonia cerealis bunyavirus]
MSSITYNTLELAMLQINVSSTSGSRACGRKRTPKGRVQKTSSTRSVSGRSKSQRKAKKCVKKNVKSSGKSHKASVNHKGAKSVLSHCLKKDLEKKHKLEQTFVKPQIPSTAGFQYRIPGKTSKSENRKFGSKWDSKHLYETRKEARMRREERENQRQQDYNERMRKKEAKKFDSNGNRVMYCLFFMLRQILDFGGDHFNYWGMEHVFFPSHLNSVGSAMNFLLEKNLISRLKPKADMKVFYFISRTDSSLNHVSLTNFPCSVECSLEDFILLGWDLPFYSNEGTQEVLEKSTESEGSDSAAIATDLPVEQMIGDEFKYGHLAVQSDKVFNLASILAHKIWQESKRPEFSNEYELTYDQLPETGSERSFMVAKKLYYELVSMLRFKQEYAELNAAGLDFSVLEYLLIVTNRCFRQTRVQPLTEFGFDNVTENVVDCLMSMVLNLASDGKVKASLSYEAKTLLEARSKKIAFRKNIEFLLPLFRIKEPFGHLGPATWKRFYLGRLQTANVKFPLNKLATYMTPPSSWDLEKAKSFMPPPADKSKYRNNFFYKPLPTIDESEDEDAPGSVARSPESVSTSIEDQHNSETPIGLHQLKSEFPHLEDSSDPVIQVDFENLAEILSKLKTKPDESLRKQNLSDDHDSSEDHKKEENVSHVSSPLKQMSVGTELETVLNTEVEETQKSARGSPVASPSKVQKSGIGSPAGSSSELNFSDNASPKKVEEQEIDWSQAMNEDSDSDDEDPMSKMMTFQFAQSDDPPFIPHHLRDKPEDVEIEVGSMSIRKPSLILQDVVFDDKVEPNESDEMCSLKSSKSQNEIAFDITVGSGASDGAALDVSELQGSCGFDCAPPGFKRQRNWERHFGLERFKKGWFTSSELAAFYSRYNQIFAVENPDGSIQFPGFHEESDGKATVVLYHFSGEMESGHWYKSEVKEITFKKKCDHGDRFTCPTDCKCLCTGLRCKERRLRLHYTLPEFFETEEKFQAAIEAQKGIAKHVQSESLEISHEAEHEVVRQPNDVSSLLFIEELGTSISTLTFISSQLGEYKETTVKISEITDENYRAVKSIIDKIERSAINWNINLVVETLRCCGCVSRAQMAMWLLAEGDYRLVLLCRNCATLALFWKTTGKSFFKLHSLLECYYSQNASLRKRLISSESFPATIQFDLKTPVLNYQMELCFFCNSNWLPVGSYPEPCHACETKVKSVCKSLGPDLVQVSTKTHSLAGKGIFKHLDELDKEDALEVRSRFQKSPLKIKPEFIECFNCKKEAWLLFSIKQEDSVIQAASCTECSIWLLTKVVMGEVLSIDQVTNSDPDWHRIQFVARMWPKLSAIYYVDHDNTLRLSKSMVTHSPGKSDSEIGSKNSRKSPKVPSEDEILSLESSKNGKENLNEELVESDLSPQKSLHQAPLNSPESLTETLKPSDVSQQPIQPEDDDYTDWVSNFSYENLKLAFPRGPVSRSKSEIDANVVGSPATLPVREKLSHCVQKLQDKYNTIEINSSTLSSVFASFGDPDKMMYFRLGSGPQDSLNHISDEIFEGAVCMSLMDALTLNIMSWNFYSSSSSSDDTDSVELRSIAEEGSSDDDWLALTTSFRQTENETQSSAASIMQFIEIESEPQWIRIHSKVDSAYVEIAKIINFSTSDVRSVALNLYTSMLLSEKLGAISVQTITHSNKYRLTPDSVELVESIMATLEAVVKGSDHERNVQELSIDLYEAMTDDRKESELDLISDLTFVDSEALGKLKMMSEHPMSTLKRLGQSIPVGNDSKLVVFDTNIFVTLFEIGIMVTFPFDLLLLKPVLNEIERLNKSGEKPGLMQFYFDVCRVNRFIISHTENDSSIGDDAILEHLKTVKNPLIFLTSDREFSEKCRLNQIESVLMPRNTVKMMAESLSVFPLIVSRDWLTTFGLSRIEVDGEGNAFSDGSRDVPFFKIQAKSLRNFSNLPKLGRLNDLVFNAEPYNLLFASFRSEAYRNQILPESDVESALDSYDSTLIDACNQSPDTFTPTRGPEVQRHIDRLKPDIVFFEQLMSVQSNYQKSCLTRNKSMPEFINTSVSKEHKRDSCWPSELAYVPKAESSIIDIVLNSMPGFDRIHRKSDLPSWALKFDADPIKIERWKKNSNKTFSNSGVIQMEGYESEDKFKYETSVDCNELLFNEFEVEEREVDLVGSSPPMEELRDLMEYNSLKIADCKVIERYSWLLNHLIHDLINISVSAHRVFVNDNNLVNTFYILGPGARNRTASSKRGVRFCFIVPSDQSTYGFYPEHIIPVFDSAKKRLPGLNLLVSRYYYMGIEDLIWKSRLWVNFTLPRFKTDDKKGLIGLYWCMFHSSSNVKKLLSFFKYFNVISLSTFSKLKGLFDKYLKILPKRESEVWLWCRIVSIVKSVIEHNEPLTILGRAEDLPDYLEKNNLYTMPRPQTTSSTHDYQMMFRDISSNVALREEVSLKKIFSKTFSELKHINAAAWQFSVKRYAKHFPHFSSNELSNALSKDFLSFFVTNSNGVNPFKWRKEKNALIFREILSNFYKETKSVLTVSNEDLVPYFLDYCLTKLESRGAFAFISIKPQKDAADREIVVQDFFTKAGHFAMQAVFKHLSSKWEGELVSKSTFDKYSFISRMKFDEKTFFVNDDMAKWSPQDLNEKFIFLINLLDHYAVIPPEFCGLLSRSFEATKDLVLLFDERVRDPHVKWYRPDQLVGKYRDGVLDKSVVSQPFRSREARMSGNLAQDGLFTPVPMTFGWPQGLKHFISSFAHGLASLYTERIFTKMLGFGTTVQTGFHSDDKNTAVTLLKTQLEDQQNLSKILNASDKSVRCFCLGQSKTKSSVSVFPTILKFGEHVRARKVSELVSVYNVEGTILDSYFRQSSNLTASFTFPTFVENHYALITRCVSVFCLSNRVIEPEVLYSEIVNYLELFFGQGKKTEKSHTLSYGSRKKVPIYLLAEFGFAADNVWSVLENFTGATEELRDMIVIKQMKNLSEIGKRFQKRVEETLAVSALIDKNAARSLFASESIRISKPSAGVFLKDKDANLNNLFRFKNEKLYSTWSSLKRSLFESGEEATGAFYSLDEVVGKVMRNLPELPYVDETVAPSKEVYISILKALLDKQEFVMKAESDISGLMTRRQVKSDLSLSNDFIEAQFLVEHGMSARLSFRLRMKWNSIIDDIEKFTKTFSITSIEEFRSMNPVWNQIKRVGVNRDPIFLLYKGRKSFTDVEIITLCERFNSEDLTFTPSPGSEPVVIKDWVKSRLSLKKTLDYRLRNFDNLVQMNLNRMLLQDSFPVPASFSLNETKWLTKMKNEMFDKAHDMKAFSRICKSIKSYITGQAEDFKRGDIVHIATEYEGTPDSIYYYEIVGEENMFVSRERTRVCCSPNVTAELRSKIRRHFKTVPSDNDQLDHIMRTSLADKRFRSGYVRAITIEVSDKGFVSASVLSSTGALAGRTTHFPLHLRDSNLPGDPFRKKTRLIEISPNSVIIHEFKGEDNVDESPDVIFGSESAVDYFRLAQKVTKALGSVLGNMNLRFCDFNSNPVGNFPHSQCKLNTGTVVYCYKDQSFNKFFKARVRSLSSDFITAFQSSLGAGEEIVSESSMIYKKRNLMAYCHRVAHLPGGDYLLYAAYKRNKLSKKELNWVINLLSGRGFLLFNEATKGFLGFSWEIIAKVARARGISLKSLDEVRRVGIEQAIFPAYAHQPMSFTSDLQHAVRLNDAALRWVEANKKYLEGEVKFTNLTSEDDLAAFKIQNEVILRLTDASKEDCINHIRKNLHALDEASSAEFVEMDAKLSELRGGKRNAAMKTLKQWCINVISSSPEFQLDYELIGRRFSTDLAGHIALIDTESRIVIFRNLPGPKPDFDIEIPIVEQLRTAVSGAVPLSFNYQNYAEFAATFEGADLVNLWKEKINEFLNDSESDFNVLSKELSDIVFVEKTFDSEHLEEANYKTWGFSKEVAMDIGKTILLTKSMYTPGHETHHRVKLISSLNQFEKYFSTSPVEFDENSIMKSEKFNTIIAKANRDLSSELVDNLVKNTLVGQIVSARLMNNEEAAVVNSDLMETDFRKLEIGISSSNPGALKSAVRVTDTGFKSTSKIWVSMKASLEEFVAPYKTLIDKENLILTWALLKTKPARNTREIALLNSVTLAVSLSDDVLTNNRLKTLFGNPINWKRFTERCQNFWRNQNLNSEERDVENALNSDLTSIARRLRIL